MYLRAFTTSYGFDAQIYDDWEKLLDDCAEDGFEWVVEVLPSGPKQRADFEDAVQQRRDENSGFFRDLYTGQRRTIV